ncbi:hypothetical protein PS6_002877 [Mucor atramentarius]
MDAMGFQLHAKITIPHLKGRDNYYTEEQLEGTLYSYPRYFAEILDNLSKEPSTSMMGHTTTSNFMKKYYANDFELEDMKKLVTTGGASESTTIINPLKAPGKAILEQLMLMIHNL